jgi:hypothetical protein
MRSIFIFIATLFFCVSSNAQVGSTAELEPYDYDTTLKGGYTILFKADDSLQYLYLKKGNNTIGELASASKGMLYKSLGYVGADFKKYFVLVHSFGSGNPHQIELIEKTTGRNILKEGAAWIDKNEEKEILLYCDNGVPTAKDKMILFNARTGTKQVFNFPSDIFNEPEILTRIQIEKVTDKLLVLKYESKNVYKTKMYSR